MWLCLAVNVTKQGISNFGRSNFKFSKTVAYITYIVFQCSLSQGYVTLNIGDLAVCTVGTGLFSSTTKFQVGAAWHGMVDVLFAMRKSQSARNSRCISTVVAYFPTQNSAWARPLHDLATIFLYSSPSVIELSTLTCTSTTTMFECLDLDFCKTGTCSGLLCWGKCTSGAKHNQSSKSLE